MKDKKTNIFIIFSYSLSVILLLLAFLIGIKYNIPFERITGDPALIYNAHPFTGFISNIGVLLWCSAACISLFTGFLFIRLRDNNRGLFFIFSGIFSTILLIDDFFMFHDYIFLSSEKFHIKQSIVYLIYALLIFLYLIRFYKLILKSDYYLLLISVFFLGSSVFTDLIFPSEGLEYFIEDSFKFIGIVSWMLFFTTTAFRFLVENTDISKQS